MAELRNNGYFLDGSTSRAKNDSGNKPGAVDKTKTQLESELLAKLLVDLKELRRSDEDFDLVRMRRAVKQDRIASQIKEFNTAIDSLKSKLNILNFQNTDEANSSLSTMLTEINNFINSMSEASEIKDLVLSSSQQLAVEVIGKYISNPNNGSEKIKNRLRTILNSLAELVRFNKASYDPKASDDVRSTTERLVDLKQTLDQEFNYFKDSDIPKALDDAFIQIIEPGIEAKLRIRQKEVEESTLIQVDTDINSIIKDFEDHYVMDVSQEPTYMSMRSEFDKLNIRIESINRITKEIDKILSLLSSLDQENQKVSAYTSKLIEIKSIIGREKNKIESQLDHIPKAESAKLVKILTDLDNTLNEKTKQIRTAKLNSDQAEYTFMNEFNALVGQFAEIATKIETFDILTGEQKKHWNDRRDHWRDLRF